MAVGEKGLDWVGWMGVLGVGEQGSFDIFKFV